MDICCGQSGKPVRQESCPMAAADVIKETTAFTASTRDDIGEKAQTLTLREDAEGQGRARRWRRKQMMIGFFLMAIQRMWQA